MGNHEFCCRCRASDFHYGSTCEQAYPKELAKAEKDRAETEQRRIKGNEACEKLVKELRKKNIPAELEKNRSALDDKVWFTVTVKGTDLIGDRKKAMEWTDAERRAKAAEKYEAYW